MKTERKPIEAGVEFGLLTAVARIADHVTPKGQKIVMWECKCACGNIKNVMAYSLRRGDTHSCGCLKHGARKVIANRTTRSGRRQHAAYFVWQNMLQRCYNPRKTGFKNWGGKGVRVADRWRFGEGCKGGFECFLADMGERPEDKSIDRFPDRTGDYAPGNCRWATMKEQQNNRRNNLDFRASGHGSPRLSLESDAEAMEVFGAA